MLLLKEPLLIQDINIITRAKRIHQVVKEHYNSDTNTSMKPCIVRIRKVYAILVQIDWKMSHFRVVH